MVRKPAAKPDHEDNLPVPPKVGLAFEYLQCASGRAAGAGGPSPSEQALIDAAVSVILDYWKVTKPAAAEAQPAPRSESAAETQ